MTDTINLFDSIAMEYIAHKGWRINADGLLVLTRAQFIGAPYTGRSYKDPTKHTIMIPSLHGSVLFFEGYHFIIVN